MKITLKAARMNKNLTQREAAKLLGVSRETLSGWETGKRFPDVPQIKKIEQVYSVHYDAISFLPSKYA